MKRIISYLALCLLLSLILGCKGGQQQQSSTVQSQPSPPTTAEQPETGKTEQPAEGGSSAGGTATITGKVIYKGTPPPQRPVSFGGDLQCASMHKDKPLYYEELVVNSNGTLRWAFVYVKEGIKGEFKPSAPVVVDQVGCQFIPHVVGVMPLQLIEFRNSDSVLHNVRALCKVNRSFNIAQPKAGMKTIQTFKEPEIGIPISCDVHPWMKSYVHVVSHPFFAVTDEQGSFTLKDVPAGTYTLEAWHEKLGTQTATVTVQPGETKTVEFTFGGG